MTYDIYLQTAIYGTNVRVILLSRLVLCVIGIRLGVKVIYCFNVILQKNKEINF